MIFFHYGSDSKTSLAQSAGPSYRLIPPLLKWLREMLGRLCFQFIHLQLFFRKGVLEGSIFHWTIFILLGGYINTANPPFSAPLLTKNHQFPTGPPSLSERSCRSSHKWNVARLQHQQYRDESLQNEAMRPSWWARFTFQQIHEVNVSVKHGIHDSLEVLCHHL